MGSLTGAVALKKNYLRNFMGHYHSNMMKNRRRKNKI